MQHRVNATRMSHLLPLVRLALAAVLASIALAVHAQGASASSVPEAATQPPVPYPDLWVKYYGEPFGLFEIVGGDYPGAVLPDGRLELLIDLVRRTPKPWVYPGKQIVGETVFGNASIRGSWIGTEKNPPQDDVQVYRLDSGEVLKLRPLSGNYPRLNRFFDSSELVGVQDKQINLTDSRCEPVFHLFQYRSSSGAPLWTRAILTSLQDESLSRCPAYARIGGYKVKPVEDNFVDYVIDLHDGTILAYTRWTLIRLRLATGYPDRPHPEVFIVDGNRVKALKGHYTNSDILRGKIFDLDDINAALRREFMNSNRLLSK